MEVLQEQEPVFELHELEHCPVALIHEATNDWWDIVCGNYRLGQQFKTREEAEKRATSQDWDLITMVVNQLFTLKQNNND